MRADSATSDVGMTFIMLIHILNFFSFANNFFWRFFVTKMKEIKDNLPIVSKTATPPI